MEVEEQQEVCHPLRIISDFFNNDEWEQAQQMLPFVWRLKNSPYFNDEDVVVVATIEVPVPGYRCVGALLDKRSLTGTTRVPLFVKTRDSDFRSGVYTYDCYEQTVCYRAASLYSLGAKGEWVNDHRWKTHRTELPRGTLWSDFFRGCLSHLKETIETVERERDLYVSTKECEAARQNKEVEKPFKCFTDMITQALNYIEVSALPSICHSLLKSILYPESDESPSHIVQFITGECLLVYRKRSGYYFLDYRSSQLKLLCETLSQFEQGVLFTQCYTTHDCKLAINGNDLTILLARMWELAGLSKSEEDLRSSNKRMELVKFIVSLTSHRNPGMLSQNSQRRKKAMNKKTMEMMDTMKEEGLQKALTPYHGFGMGVYTSGYPQMNMFFPVPVSIDDKVMLAIRKLCQIVKRCHRTARPVSSTTGEMDNTFMGVTVVCRDGQFIPELVFLDRGSVFHVDFTFGGNVCCEGRAVDYFGGKPFCRSGTFIKPMCRLLPRLSDEEKLSLHGYLLKSTLEYFHPLLLTLKRTS